MTTFRITEFELDDEKLTIVIQAEGGGKITLYEYPRCLIDLSPLQIVERVVRDMVTTTNRLLHTERSWVEHKTEAWTGVKFFPNHYLAR